MSPNNLFSGVLYVKMDAFKQYLEMCGVISRKSKKEKEKGQVKVKENEE